MSRRVLPEVTFALNTTKSATTKRAPCQLVFGRQPVLTEDMLLGVGEHRDDVPTASEYLSNNKDKLSDVIIEARKCIEVN